LGQFKLKLTKIGYARCAFFCAQVLKKEIFQHLIGIEILWGFAVETIKIGPTVAE